MKLSDIKTFVVGNPPPHYGGRYFVFVKLITDGNVEGIGEAYCVPFDPHLVAKMIEDVFERYLRNEDPHDIEKMWRRVYSAGFTQHPDLTLMGVLSALEMACWDIVGKEAGQPIAENQPQQTRRDRPDDQQQQHVARFGARVAGRAG